MNKENIYQNIRTSGGRVTKICKEIVRFVSEADCLTSQAAILAGLKQNGLQPNRSTLYRELLSLSKNNLLIKNTISGVDYYEIPTNHHHHLVCVKCNSIQKVEMKDRLHAQERKIAKQTKFNIINHSLEFYGYCQNCNK